ncbi:MAG TPA: aminodeoxychorismate/anthranilate synthase component I, partial [Lacipirellula sp.]
MNAPGLPLVEPLPGQFTPLEAFRRLAALPHVIFFDSAVQDQRLGRYSFVAADPFEWIERPARREGEAPAEPALSEIEQLLNTFAPHASPAPGLPPFQGGVAGLLSYDLNRSLERIPPPRYEDF